MAIKLNSTRRRSTSTSTSSTNNNAGVVAGWRSQTRNAVLLLCCVGLLAIDSIVTTTYSVHQKYVTTTATLPSDEVVSGGSTGSTYTASSTTTAASNRNLSAIVFHMGRRGQGFGSLTVNAFIYGMFFENRTFYVNELELETYHWNETVRLYEGFFEHNFPLYRPGHTDFEAMNNNNPVTACDMLDWRDSTPSYMNGCNVLFAHIQGPILGDVRHKLVSIAKQQLGRFGLDVLYDPLAKYMCEKLRRLSQQAQQEVDALIAIQSANMSDGPFPSKFDVAFHMRRGDKGREARLWDAEKYLETYEKANPAGAAKAKHCFLATDDYAVVNELKEAMKQTNITCQVWTLTDENYRTTRDRGDFILYLAQQHIMVQADYFVGTFTSNIGTVVSLFRACPSWANHSSSEHYYHSYGVGCDTAIVPFG